jgi:tRNA(Ile)-lysidine synthase
MNQLVRTLQQQLTALCLHTQQELIVAYSGGVDSHVLLHALVALREQAQISNPISAIHIHHGLSANADAWLAHCQQTCQTLNIRFQGAKVSLVRDPGQSLEAEARAARYNKLLELAPTNSVILLAQHQDDQLETFLLQLKRGAGPKGLAAMPQFSTKSLGEQNKVVYLARPLLRVSQQHILDYANQCQLNWIEDESNQNTEFERNFLRHRIVPSLKEKWPDIAKTVSRSAQLCAEHQQLLDEVAQEKLLTIRCSDNTLRIDRLNDLSTAWLHQIIRQWLDKQGIQCPSQAILQKLKPELMDAKDDANPILQWGDWQFRRFDQRLYVIPFVPSIPPHTLLWQGQKTLSLPNPLGTLSNVAYQNGHLSESDLVLDTQNGEIKIQFGGYAQRFTPADNLHSKPLKQWYKEWKIPSWQRNEIALVLQNDKPVGLLIQGVWRLAKTVLPENASEQKVVFRYKSDT